MTVGSDACAEIMSGAQDAVRVDDGWCDPRRVGAGDEHHHRPVLPSPEGKIGGCKVQDHPEDALADEEGQARALGQEHGVDPQVG